MLMTRAIRRTAQKMPISMIAIMVKYFTIFVQHCFTGFFSDMHCDGLRNSDGGFASYSNCSSENDSSHYDGFTSSEPSDHSPSPSNPSSSNDYDSSSESTYDQSLRTIPTTVLVLLASVGHL